MMRLPAFLRRAPDPRAGLLAEALALYEDGLEIAAILALYPEEDQRWLRPLLATGRIVSDALGDEDASYYFEGSLKAKVLEAAAGGVIGGGRGRRAGGPLASPRRRGAALAGAGALAAAIALAVAGFGFVTAGDAVPGEWNYGFKRAAEGARARFASGGERINVNISQAQARIDEIQRLAVRGDLNRGHISRFTNELADLRALAEEEAFDPLQRAKVRGLSESAVAVLAETDEELAPAAEEAIDRAHEVAAAVSGGAGVEPVPAPAATPEPAPEPSATPTPAPEPEPEPSAAPAATETPAPAATPEPDAEASPAPDGGEVGLDADGATQPLSAPTEPPAPAPAATPEPPPVPDVTATPEPPPAPDVTPAPEPASAP